MMISKLVKLSGHLNCIIEAMDLGKHCKLIIWHFGFVTKTGLMTYQCFGYCMHCISFSHSAPASRLGVAKGWEGT